MKYEELIRIHKKYEKETNFDTAYNKFIKRRDVWDNLNKISINQIKSVVLAFLNQWNCSIAYRWFEKLLSVLKELKEPFDLLKEQELDTVNLDGTINGKPISELIQHIFEKLSLVTPPRGHKRGYTAPSKVMHMINPKLFPMWDDKIRRNIYGYSNNPKAYVHFMRDVKKEILEILEPYCTQHKCNKTEAKKRIALENNNKTLIKLLDECNWWKANKDEEKVIEESLK